MEQNVTNIKKKKRVRIYTIIRAVLILLVVIGHSVYSEIHTTVGGISYNFPSTWFLNIFDKLASWVYSFHMPAFFALSGAVYFLSEKKSFDELFKNKFKRLVIPYFLYGLFFMLIIKKLTGFYSGTRFYVAIQQFFLGNEDGHLWFLIRLFWCTLIFYVIKKIFTFRKPSLNSQSTSNLNNSKNIISMVAMLLVTLFLQLYYGKYTPIQIPQITAAMSYIFWFTLGYCFEEYRKDISLFKDTKKLFLTFIVTGVVVIVNFKYKLLDSFKAVFLNIIFIYLFCQLIANSKYSHLKIIDFLEKYSMQIYLLHDPLEYVILYLSNKINLLSFFGGDIIYILLRTVGVIALSVVLSNWIKKATKKGKELFNNFCKKSSCAQKLLPCGNTYHHNFKKGE